MRKIIPFLAGLLAAATILQDASALPVFARQTGMACSACHFQHFPMLNSFGRAFKASGFTIIGAQGKVEDEGLSIPNTLNMAVLTTAGYVKTNAKANSTIALNLRDPSDGSIYVLGTNGELSLFAGGRVAENVGFLAELGFLGENGAAGLGSAKAPMLFEVADGVRAGPVIFTTGGQGASYGFEALNTGANAVHTMLFIGGDANGSIGPTVSAQQYIGTGTAATGVALVANSTRGWINVTKFHQVGPNDLGGEGGSLGSTYIRVAGTFDMAGWDTGVGVQSWSGRSIEPNGVAAVLADQVPGPPTGIVAPLVDTKATAIDFQMQGAVGDKPLGVYVTYARAPSTNIDNPGVGNVYNPGNETRSAFTVSAEFGVVPEKVTVGVGIRRGKSGQATATVANASDNSLLVEGSYKLAQNVMLNLYYTKQSGDLWDQAYSDLNGSSQVTLNLATLF